MRLMLAKEQALDVGTWPTAEDNMEGMGMDFVSLQFQVTCRPTVISNPDERRVELLPYREGLFNITLRTDIEHPNEKPTPSMQIHDADKLLTYIMNISCSDLFDQRIRLTATIRIAQSVVFEFDGWFYGIQLVDTDAGDLELGDYTRSPCSWKAVMTLLTCHPSGITITLFLTAPCESNRYLAEKDVLPILLLDKTTDMHIQSVTGGLIPCHKSILSGLSNLLWWKLRDQGREAKNYILKLEISDAAIEEILVYAYTGFFKTPRFPMNLALELLQTSHVYEIVRIWSAVTDNILLGREDEYFNAADCLNMFQYLVTLQGERSIVDLASKLLIVFSSKQQKEDTSKLNQLMATDTAFRKAWLMYSCKVIRRATVP